MNADINYLAILKEGPNIELKEATNKVPDSFYETYSAFCNTDGGTIYLGIKEGKKNKILGVSNPIEQKKNIIAALHSREKVSYCALSEKNVRILSVGDKNIMQIDIPEAPKEVKPVYIKGNLSLSYERAGGGDFKLNEDSITRMLIDRRQTHFDSVPNVLDLDFSRVDADTLKKYRTYLNEISPNNIFSRLSDHDFLLRIGALKTKEDGKEVLSNGAVLFFGQITDIMQISPNFFLDYREKITNYSRWDYRIVSDDISLNCNLYNFFEIVSERLLMNVPNPFKTNGISNLNGTDLKRSIIEGLANAISNNDYLSTPGICIEKTANSICITNSGDVPTGIEQAKKGGISEPRNSNIMNYLRIIQVTDRAGTGIPNIFDVFASYQFPTPGFFVLKNPLRTRLSLNFLQLPSNTRYRQEKLDILAYLESRPEGVSSVEISKLINKKSTITNQILNELLLIDLISTNGMKTKGKKFMKNS